MIEAMACGTPVIAVELRFGTEVIDHGVTGFIVDSEARGGSSGRGLAMLDRATVRDDLRAALHLSSGWRQITSQSTGRGLVGAQDALHYQSPCSGRYPHGNGHNSLKELQQD